MRKIITWTGWLAAAVICFFLVRGSCAGPDPITVGQVRQDGVLGPLPASAMSNPAALLAAANAYRTNSGWISASNGRIWAGLPGPDEDSGRIWSAPYSGPAGYRHEVTVWLGQGGGVSYQYQLFDHWSVGGMLIYAGEQVSGLAGVGYRW